MSDDIIKEDGLADPSQFERMFGDPDPAAEGEEELDAEEREELAQKKRWAAKKWKCRGCKQRPLQTCICRWCVEAKGPCHHCGMFFDVVMPKKGDAHRNQVRTSFAAVKSLKARVPISTGLAELDKVLGGGLLCGNTLMLGAVAGTGKTTLLLQVLVEIAKQGIRCFFASGEMIAQQNLDYVKRLIGDDDVSEEILSRIDMLCDNRGLNVEDVADRVLAHKAKVLFLDSAQHAQNPGSDANMGSAEQVDAVTEYLSSFSQMKKIATIFISHLTKLEDYSGSQKAQHAVDGLLMMASRDVIGEDGYFLNGTSRNDVSIIRELYWKGKSRQGPADVKALLQVSESYRFEPVSDTVRMRMARMRLV